MNSIGSKFLAATLSATAVLAVPHSSMAADTEAFSPQTTETGRPNVLFLVDSTASLAQPVNVPLYDPDKVYADLLPNNQRCDASKVFFDTTSAGGFPDCRSNKVGSLNPATDLICDRASTVTIGGQPVKIGNASTLKADGRLETKFLVKKGSSTNYLQLSNTYKYTDGKVYCDGASNAPPAAEFASSAVVPTRLYTGNWLNYIKAIPLLDPVPGPPRMDVLKQAFRAIAQNPLYAGKINIGMMRTSTTGAQQQGGAGKGGMVVFPIRSMTAQDIYGDYHGGTTALDDFLWTLDERVACKGDQNCGGPGTMPAVGSCPLGSNCAPVMYPNGDAKALAEMMFEANLYFAGGDVQYGTRSAIDPTIEFDSVEESLANAGDATGNLRYQSPIENVCANNYIVLLTDGLSSQDSSSNLDIKKLLQSLPTTVLTTGGYSADVNKVDCTKNSWSTNAKAPSECIDDLAFYLQNADFDSNPDNRRPGVKTYAVGFALDGSVDEADARKLLNDVAAAGGTGEAVFANSADTILFALEDIISKVLTGNTAFSAPSVTINAFNRTQNLNDLYMAVFRPEYLRKWEGNVKKYRINPVTGEIEGQQQGVPAVSSLTGFFEVGSQSLWSDQVDGLLAPIGGAASKLPDSADRKILVDGSGTTLQPLGTFVAGLDAAAAVSLFGTGVTPADAVALTNWLYGTDSYDEYPARPDDDEDGLFDDGNGVTAEEKKLMGDPLHSRPAIAVYGRPGQVLVDEGTGEPVDHPERDARVYITTNEGLLHALDSETGVEKWAFMPKELLDRLKFLTDQKTETELGKRTDPQYYGLDGTVRILRIDRKQDGRIDWDDGDRVFLYFGMRRGGGAYYAFDVTDPEVDPKLMWRWELPDAADGAQSWSNPTIGDFVRVNISDTSKYGSFETFNNADSNNRYVLVIGGGYDPTNDAMGFARDTRGNGIYMLDAADGTVIWSAGGPEDSSATKQFDRMRHSIVSDVRVVDLSGDRYADRMYAADLGGQVWRFDIFNGNSSATLVEGGVMASVGGEEDPAKDRRFYYGPDVAEVRCGGVTFYNVAVGSGDRENPVTDKTVRNSFFSFRDYMTRKPVDSSDYRADCDIATETCFKPILDDGSLVDVTTTAKPTVTPDKSGWKLDLVGVSFDPDTGTASTKGRGEKALAESRTFAGSVYFTTYAPEFKNELECGTQVGVNRLYVVNACNAAPVNNNDGNVGQVTVADRTLTLAQGSIAPEVVFVFPSPPPGCTTQDCMPPPQCLVGLQSCGRGLPNRPVRVFWRERGAE